MNIVLWIVAGLLAAILVAAGLQKVTQPKSKLIESGMAWVVDFSDGSVKALGALELLAAVGLILPGILKIAPILVPIAAVGVMLLMIGAAVVHSRHETNKRVGWTMNAVIFVLALVVAIGRFGPYAF